MNSWKVIWATTVIFGTGVFAGGLLINHVSRHFHHPPRPFIEQLDRTLDLTPEQHQKIAKIIADGQEQNHEIWTNCAPKMRAVMQDVDHQICEQLTPPQKKKFNEMTKHFGDLMRQFGQRRPQFDTNAPPSSP